MLPLGLGGALRSSCTCQATQEERWPTGCERSDPRLEPFLRDLTRLELQQMQGAGLPLGSGKPSQARVVSQTENGAGLKRRCDGGRPVCVIRKPSAQRQALIARAPYCPCHHRLPPPDSKSARGSTSSDSSPRAASYTHRHFSELYVEQAAHCCLETDRTSKLSGWGLQT